MCPFGGGGAGSPCDTMWPGPRPTYVQSFILIRQTVWPHYTNVTDRTDRQRTDSIGRTVLQTVAQKRKMLNPNKCTKTKPNLNQHSSLRIGHMWVCVCVCISLCTTVIHNTAQNSSDNFPSYPPDNHHCSDAVHWRER